MGGDGCERVATLSVVIPAWSGTEAIAAMTLDLCRYVRAQCDELIISEDAICRPEHAELADIYACQSSLGFRLGHAKNLNFGFQMATKDFVAMIDNDVSIETGTLRDLCVPGRLVYPRWSDWKEYLPPQIWQGLWQWFVVAPREFFVECPPYGNRYTTHGEAIDQWGDEIRERFPLQLSHDVTYRHSGRTSYGAAGLAT